MEGTFAYTLAPERPIFRSAYLSSTMKDYRKGIGLGLNHWITKNIHIAYELNIVMKS